MKNLGASLSARALKYSAVVYFAAFLLLPASGFGVKGPSKSNLDSLTFSRPDLRVAATPADAESIQSLIPNLSDLDRFRSENGIEWHFVMDQRSGRLSLLDGGAIPCIPGVANSLSPGSFGISCDNASCMPVEKVEALAREFLYRYSGVFQLDPGELELDPVGSGPAGNSMYFLRFQWKYKGIPVEGASVFFRINNGNLIQVAADKIGPIQLDPLPTLSAQTAWEILRGYLGEYWSDKDEVLDRGSLLIMPVTPKGTDPDVFAGGYGSQIGFDLVYRLAFRRPDVQGTWEAIVDAHSGEILRFVDTDRYGHVHGGIRPSDGLPPEEDRPFPGADIGGGLYTDSAGNFTGNNATVTLTGKYAHIADTCGSISATTTTGDLNFGSGATGTDCTVPAGNTYGAGNTKPSRTLFYNVSNINVRAQVWNPSNTWLPNNYVTLHVNGTAECNARSGGADIYFYKQIAGSCANLGEIPSVAMHEWGHSYDTNDGSGGQSPPLETYADWTGVMSTHLSCLGAGFLASGNCGGYGNPCTACTGVRDADYLKHNPATPWTSANHGTLWSCTSGSYNGPCGWEDHCESGISTQALWDFVYRDLEAAPTNMDITSAWMLEDRLWFTGVQTLDSMYTCSGGVTSGCTGNVLYTVMRAIDDDGDGTANGTPHAAAIFAALNRHGLACGAAGDATNQNHVNSSCPTQTITTLSGTAGNNQVILNWPAVTNATRYWIYRNEGDCAAGFTKIATVNAPTTTYADSGVANGTAYNYRFQTATASDSCNSAVSNCVTVTPQPCAGSITLDRTLYNCADTVNVSVLDSTPGASPWTVTAWSTTDATVKTITLTNNPPGSAIYTGSFTTTTGAAGANQVRVADSATITIRYTDKDYCGTPNTNVDKTVNVDCTGPVISNVQVTNITDSGATVTWTTNENANSRVTYGTVSPPGTNKDDLANYVTSHSVTLTGLTGCTKYYFSVTSADVAGNSASDSNGGTYFSFTTAGRAFAMGPDTVEGGVLSWVATGTAGALWHQDTCKAASGTHSWKAGASDAPTCTAQYVISADSYLTWSANITLGSTGHGYHLRWNEWYDTESGYDWLTPQISTDGGGTWSNLVTHYAGSSGGWLAKDVDLAAYTGSTVRIRFWFHSDSSQNGLGWYVDDIEISKTQSCTADVSYQSNTFADACSSGGAGNANGVIDSGEDITVHPVLKNTGSQGATGLSATLSTSTPGITVTSATVTYPDLASGASAACDAPHFAFSVGTGVACGTTINFSLHITAAGGGGPWDRTFTMTVGNVVAGGTITDFSQNFDSVTPPALPAGWTVSHTSGNDWVTASGGCTGNGLRYPYNSTQAANSWAYTPGIALTAGVTYTLAFNQKIQSTTWPETMEVKAGTAATPAGQTITVLASATYSNTTCTLRSPTFTVPATGTYYLGFHCTSVADTYYLWVDDVALTHTSTPSCTMTACTPVVTPPGEAAPGDTPATAQSWTNKTTQTWPAVTGATGYTLYRGILADLPQLLNSSTDSCTKTSGSATSATVNDDPAGVSGRFYWYLVTASNGAGEGTPGSATAGTRVVNSSGTCP